MAAAILAFAFAFEMLGQSPKPSPTPTPPAWQVRSTTSKMDDSKTVVLVRRANESITGWPNRRSTPTLILRCQEGNIEAYINTDLAAQPEVGRHSSVSALVRYDKQPAVEIEMSESVDNGALFFPDATETIESMLKAGVVRLRFTPFNWTPQETTFTLRGLDRVVGQLERACSWDRATIARDRLADALRDLGNQGVVYRTIAAMTLERIATPELTVAIEPLTRALGDSDDIVRGRAVRALAKIKGSVSLMAVPDLVPLLSAGDDSTSIAAAEILERMGPAAADAVPALRLALEGLDQQSPAARAMRAAVAAITRGK